MSGVLEAVQLQESADLATQPSLKDMEQTWRTVLGSPELQASRVVASCRDGWSPLVSELVKSGVAHERAWDPLETHRDLGEIQAALRQQRH